MPPRMAEGTLNETTQTHLLEHGMYSNLDPVNNFMT